MQTVQETTNTPDISQKLCLTSRSHKGRHFSFKDMTTKELINCTMLYEQHEVIRELKKHDSTLMQGLRNSDNARGVKEWWLVPPYFAGMLSIEKEIILCSYDCCWWGRQVTGQPLTQDAVLKKLAKIMWVEEK